MLRTSQNIIEVFTETQAANCAGNKNEMKTRAAGRGAQTSPAIKHTPGFLFLSVQESRIATGWSVPGACQKPGHFSDISDHKLSKNIALNCVHTPSFWHHFQKPSAWPHTLNAGGFISYSQKKTAAVWGLRQQRYHRQRHTCHATDSRLAASLPARCAWGGSCAYGHALNTQKKWTWHVLDCETFFR